MPLEKAEIVNVDTGDRHKCLFNPSSYTFDKKNNWPVDQKAGANVSQTTFGGGEPATLAMELFFDTYADAAPGSKPADVRTTYTDKLWNLMLVNPKKKDKKNKKGRPPIVRFVWGRTWAFEGVILSQNQKFTMFLADGIPVRATVTVSFRQSKDEANIAKQNPTSGGIGGDRVWTVTDGDTLGWIAHAEYGDTSLWRLIAEANHLEQVRHLTPGMTLVIPNG